MISMLCFSFFGHSQFGRNLRSYKLVSSDHSCRAQGSLSVLRQLSECPHVQASYMPRYINLNINPSVVFEVAPHLCRKMSTILSFLLEFPFLIKNIFINISGHSFPLSTPKSSLPTQLRAPSLSLKHTELIKIQARVYKQTTNKTKNAPN